MKSDTLRDRGAQMKFLKVLGPGCKRCKQLEHNVREAIAGSESEYDVQKIDQIEDMVKYNMLKSPGLVVDERLVVSGQVPTIEEIRELIK